MHVQNFLFPHTHTHTLTGGRVVHAAAPAVSFFWGGISWGETWRIHLSRSAWRWNCQQAHGAARSLKSRTLPHWWHKTRKKKKDFVHLIFRNLDITMMSHDIIRTDRWGTRSGSASGICSHCCCCCYCCWGGEKPCPLCGLLFSSWRPWNINRREHTAYWDNIRALFWHTRTSRGSLYKRSVLQIR